MRNSASLSATPLAENLRRLVTLRMIAIGAQALAVWVAIEWLDLTLPWQAIAAILVALLLVNALTWLRLYGDRAVSDGEMLFHLTIDVFALTGVLYFSGGSTNPFAPLYLLPLTLAAVTLPAPYTWSVVALTVACYSALLFFYVPLPAGHAGHNEAFELHVLGMWLGFLLSAGLIGYFAVRMRETLRERERLRADMREQQLRHERLLALGTLAAGAAHELGTPLATMTLLADELARDPAGAPNRLPLLRDQLIRCKEILASLSASAGQTRAESGSVQPLDTYIAELIVRWQRARPDVIANVSLHGETPAPRIVAEQTLGQALLNIANNAADASPHDVALESRWTSTELSFDVYDRGPGLKGDVREHAGEPFFTTKAPGQGMGLGLFLARGTIERLGGSILLVNREGGGAVCRVRLPLDAIRVGER